MKPFTVKGFNLSTDYNLLWDLIFSGHRIPAWVLYREGDETDRLELWDMVEVKKSYFGEKRYSIGTRGIGYEGDQNKEDFLRTCEHYSLHFITPNKEMRNDT